MFKVLIMLVWIYRFCCFMMFFTSRIIIKFFEHILEYGFIYLVAVVFGVKMFRL